MMSFILFTNRVKNSISLRLEDGKKTKTLQEAKNIFEKLKTDPKSVLFSEETIEKQLLRKLKKHLKVRTIYCYG